MRATAKAMSAARRLRGHLSRPEYLLWLRVKQLRGEIRFRRQHAIGPYVVDFYCPKSRLVIEVDGAHHDFRSSEDQERDLYLRELGLNVVRFAAQAVLADPDGVTATILQLASGPSTPQLR